MKSKPTPPAKPNVIGNVLMTIVFIAALVGAFMVNPDRWNDVMSVFHKAHEAVAGQPYESNIKQYLKNHANDPASIQIVNIGKPGKPWSDGLRHVKCDFRSKNGFGALMLYHWTFAIRSDGSIATADDSW